MNADEFVKEYVSKIRTAQLGEVCQIAFPFKLYGDDRISSVQLTENTDGTFTVTDGGNTYRLLYDMGVNPEDYGARVRKICKAFYLTIEDGVVSRVIADLETNQTFVQFTSFLMGLSHLATLKCLE